MVNKEIYCIFKTACIISLFHKIRFFSLPLQAILMFYINHAIHFKYPPRPRKKKLRLPDQKTVLVCHVGMNISEGYTATIFRVELSQAGKENILRGRNL